MVVNKKRMQSKEDAIKQMHLIVKRAQESESRKENKDVRQTN